jgi:hypothetical protein
LRAREIDSFIPAMACGQGYSPGAVVQSLGMPDRSWVPSEQMGSAC